MKSILCVAVLICGVSAAQADVRGDYELTVSTVKSALAGWQLYNDKQFAGQFQNGHYTDPTPRTKVKDFWSDGRYANLDRDGNGHFETIFTVHRKELVYVGSVGTKGTFVHTARKFRQLQGKPIAAFTKTLNGR